MKAGCVTCNKREWQGWKWCGAAANFVAEEAVECVMSKQQEFAGRRIGERLQRRMQLELCRLQGILEKKRLGM